MPSAAAGIPQFATAPRAGLPVTEPGADRHDIVLLETALFEIHELAVQTAMVTSTLNSLRLARPAAIDDLPRHLPVDRGLGRIVDELAVAGRVPPAAASAVADFLRALPPARSAVVALLAAEAPAREQLRGAVVAGWQSLCGLARAAVREMDELNQGTLPSFYRHNTQIVLGLLGRSAAGGFPCLDLNGVAHYPAMPHRRASLRYPLLQYCRIVCGALELEAIAKDVSVGGMGLLQAHGLHVGDPVTVELASGRRFDGAIAWTTPDGAAGMAFASPLDAADPLVTAR